MLKFGIQIASLLYMKKDNYVSLNAFVTEF